MTYVCIKCRNTWYVGEPSDSPSGANCETCAVDRVRQRQLSRGYFLIAPDGELTRAAERSTAKRTENLPTGLTGLTGLS
jgi:hypothetical protein